MLGLDILTSLIEFISLVFSFRDFSLFDGSQQQQQPQLKLSPPLAPPEPFQQIISGFYSVPPVIAIHDRHGTIQWAFTREDASAQILPNATQHNLYTLANDATEVKWINEGKSIAAVFGDLLLIITYAPGTSNDKQITFAVPRHETSLVNAHTLEPLPGGKVAVTTTGQREWDGILVYDANAPLVDDPPILQNITGLRAIHGMIWDETEQILWAAGTDVAADGSDNIPAYNTIQGYPFDPNTGLLDADNKTPFYKVNQAYDLDTEWGQGFPWWSGAHDLVPIPNKRKLLMTTDTDLFIFDLSLRQFTLSGSDVVDTYLPGFEPTSDDRYGVGRNAQYIELPRCDIKSASLAPDGSFLYVQSGWQRDQSNGTNIVVDGHRTVLEEGHLIYRSRFFADIPGWEKPKS